MEEAEIIKLNRIEMNNIIRGLRKVLRDYNRKIKERSLYLRPYNLVFKKNGEKIYYIGYYWFTIETKNNRSLLRYKGSSKPADIPDPPEIPRVKIKRSHGEYLINKQDLEKLERFIGIKIKEGQEAVVEKVKFI
mgnify:FL=1